MFVAIRAFNPDAKEMFVVEEGTASKEYLMDKIMEEGFYELILADRNEVFPYKLKSVTFDDRVELYHDSYHFCPHSLILIYILFMQVIIIAFMKS